MLTPFWRRVGTGVRWGPAPRRQQRRRSLHLEPLETRCLLSGDVIFQWNDVLRQVARVPGVQPPTASLQRSYAMLHVAMFDAVNAIDGSYTRYFAYAPAPDGASPEAAAAQAAYDILVGLYPTQRATFDAALTVSLKDIPAPAASGGIFVGHTVAQQIRSWRAGDRWDVIPPVYDPGHGPGIWEPTPPAYSPATFTHYSNVVPFAIFNSAQFRPSPPPALDSDTYAAAYNETKEVGRVDSTSRTDDQTLVARLWAAVGTPTGSGDVWNTVAEAVADTRSLSLPERARLFALLNVALHDGLGTSFPSKFYYNLWRPVTAIHRADEDGNPATTPDPDWMPLLVTPPYPTYAGNAATIGATSATILASFFGQDDIPFQASWEVLNVTRSYPGFKAMGDEQANSRIWGGIHFAFDSAAGQQIGANVANYVFANFMLPLHGGSPPRSGSGIGPSGVHGIVGVMSAHGTDTLTSRVSVATPVASQSSLVPTSDWSTDRSVASADIRGGQRGERVGAASSATSGLGLRHAEIARNFSCTVDDDMFGDLDGR